MSAKAIAKKLPNGKYAAVIRYPEGYTRKVGALGGYGSRDIAISHAQYEIDRAEAISKKLREGSK